jgi:hypothetical protein
MTVHPGLSLNRFVDGVEPETPIMPLMHSTGGDGLLALLQSRVLKTSKCPVFNEPLLYFFYGRPAYRPYGNVLNTSNPSFRPVCLLFRPEALTDVKRIVPLDTGAFKAGLYSRHVTSHMTVEHFVIGGKVTEAARFIHSFFGSNRTYYFGQLRTDLQLKATDMVAQCYRSIVADTGISDVDDRRSTIELQSITEMHLNCDTLLAAALPEAFLEDDAISDLLATCNAQTITYDIYSDRPAHDVREIMARVKDWLATQGYLP